MSIAAHTTSCMNRDARKPSAGWKVQYNGFTQFFPSERKARAFARDIKDDGCCPCVKPA